MRRSGVRRRLRASIFLGVGLALTGIALLAYGTNVVKQLELNTVDTRFSVRGSQGAPKDLAVVQIDDTTFTDFNNQGRQNIRYPFPRSLFAGVIDRLCKDGAKVVAYDIQFTEQTTIAEDNRLIDSKGTRHQLFLSDTTREALQNEVADLLYVDEFEVRGREAKVKIWSISAATDEPTRVAATAL